MPRELKITDGPSFRGFAISNGILTESQWDQVFTMNKPVPDGFTTIHKDKKIFQILLCMFGKSPRTKNEENDEFIFIASKYNQWFYVGTYNTRTRKGECKEYTAAEFFTQVNMRDIFPY